VLNAKQLWVKKATYLEDFYGFMIHFSRETHGSFLRKYD
jgi:hypothetical protein